MQIAATTHVDANPYDVWSFLGDIARYPEWLVPVARVGAPRSSIGVGTLYQAYGSLPPLRVASDWMVTDFEPPRRQVHLGDDRTITVELRYDLLALDGGTILTQTVTLHPRFWIAPLALLLWKLRLRRALRGAMEASLTNARRLLEGHSGHQ